MIIVDQLKKDEETLEHLLIHYPAVWGLRAALIAFPRIDWVCPLLAKDLMMGWTTFPIKKESKKNLEGSPH